MATKQTDVTQAQQPQQIDRLHVGKVVHYTDNSETCRAAIVTLVPLDESGKPSPDGLCSLVWFDYQTHAAGNVRYKSLVSDDPAEHTWHEVH
jgi:hypothetical protein